jgi:hypothetical protein
MPAVHAWTRRQRALIVGSIVLALASFGALIYAYERYYRGPGEELLYGRWAATDFISEGTIYFRFRSNQTFSVGGDFEDEFGPWASGRWYAGGSLIFLRFSGDDFAGIRPVVLRIVDIQNDELRVRLNGEKTIYTFRRSIPHAADASNQAMQRTAGRTAFQLPMTSAFNPKRRSPSPAVADLVSR